MGWQYVPCIVRDDVTWLEDWFWSHCCMKQMYIECLLCIRQCFRYRGYYSEKDHIPSDKRVTMQNSRGRALPYRRDGSGKGS